MRTRIAICLMSLLTVFAVAGLAWAGDNDESPDDDPEFDCPDGTFPMEGSSTTCVKLGSEDCPEGWLEDDQEYDGDPGTCTCESGTTNPDGTCNLEGNNDDSDGTCEPGEPCWPFDNPPWGYQEDGVDCGPGFTGVNIDITSETQCPQFTETPWTDGCEVMYCQPDCPAGTYRDGILEPCLSNDCDEPWPGPHEPCLKSWEVCGGDCANTPYLPVSLCDIVASQPYCEAIDGAILDDGDSIRWVRGFTLDRPTVVAEFRYPENNPCARGQMVDSGTCRPACEVVEVPCVEEVLWIYDQWTAVHISQR